RIGLGAGRSRQCREHECGHRGHADRMCRLHRSPPGSHQGYTKALASATGRKAKAAAPRKKARRLWYLQPHMLECFAFFDCFLLTFFFVILLPSSIFCSELWVVVAWPGG